MSALHWISVTEQVDAETLQEFKVELDKGFRFRGQTLKLCPGCKRWVSQHDYKVFCSNGMHEFSREVSLSDLKAGIK